MGDHVKPHFKVPVEVKLESATVTLKFAIPSHWFKSHFRSETDHEKSTSKRKAIVDEEQRYVPTYLYCAMIITEGRYEG